MSVSTRTVLRNAFMIVVVLVNILLIYCILCFYIIYKAFRP